MSTYTAGKLVSLNVGMHKPLAYRGKTVPSGIFKTPVEGSLHIDWTELEGDAQADLVAHGGPNRRVYVHPLENYPYWERRIGVRWPDTAPLARTSPPRAWSRRRWS